MITQRLAVLYLLIFTLFFAISCSNPEAKKKDHYAKALQYVEKDNTKAAIIELRNAIQLDPKYAEARYQLGLLYLKEGNLQNAFQELQRTASLDPDNLDANIKMAEFYLISKKKEESRKHVEKVLSKQPDYPDALALLANLEIIEGNFKNALEALEKVPTAEQESDRFYNIKGRIYAAQKKWPEAEELFQKAIDVNPENFTNFQTMLLIYQEQKKTQEAEILLHTMAEHFPDNPQPHLFLASLHATKKEFSKTESELIKAIDKAKENPELRLKLFGFYSKQRDLEKAEQFLLKSTEEIPDSLLLQTSLANFWFDKKEYEKAKTKMEEILNVENNHSGAKLLNARFLLKDGKFHESLDLLTKINKDYPKWDAPYFNISLAHYNLGAIELAQINVEKAIEKSPGKSKYHTLLAQILLQQQENQLAKQEALIAIKLDNRNFQAALILCKTLLQGKEFDKAQKLLEKIKTQLPENPEILGYLSLAYLGLEDKENAKTTLQELLSLSPGNTRYLALYSKIAAQEDPATAIKIVQQYIEKAPESGSHHLLLGDIYSSQKMYKEALASYKKAQQLSPDHPGSYMKSAALMRSQGQTEKAILEYRELIAKHPDSISGYMGLATLLEVDGKQEESVELYKNILAIKPDFAPAANNLAWRIAEKENGDLGEALRLAMIAKQVMSDEPHIADTLGWVHYKRESFTLAESQFEHALSIKTDDPTITYHLALAQYGNSKNDKAIASIKKALESTANFPEHDEAEALLKQWESGN